MTPAHEMALLLGVMGVLFVVAAAVRWLQGYREHERLEEEWSWPSEEEELLALVRTEYAEGRIDVQEMEAATEHVLTGGRGCKRFPFLPLFPLPGRYSNAEELAVLERERENAIPRGVMSGDQVAAIHYLRGLRLGEEDRLLEGVAYPPLPTEADRR